MGFLENFIQNRSFTMSMHQTSSSSLPTEIPSTRAPLPSENVGANTVRRTLYCSVSCSNTPYPCIRQAVVGGIEHMEKKELNSCNDMENLTRREPRGQHFLLWTIYIRITWPRSLRNFGKNIECLERVRIRVPGLSCWQRGLPSFAELYN